MGKYPRTPHLPWSEGVTDDDRKIETTRGLLGQKLVVTEKLDGSNVALSNRNIYARSHSDSPRHPAFDYLKQIWHNIAYDIPPNVVLWGEWCYAIHSIEYERLPSYGPFIFAVSIDIPNEGRYWSSWAGVRKMASQFELPTVPVISANYITRTNNSLAVLSNVPAVSRYGPECEGTVVRTYDGFRDVLFPYRLAKNVRKNHVQTDEHWSRNWEKQEVLS